MLWKGSENVEKYFIGSKAVSSIWLGSKLIWTAISSCFGAGFWNNLLKWDNNDGWKNQ